MTDRNKSVIEHLEYIESSINNLSDSDRNEEKLPKKKELTISEMIGEPFDPYFDKSTVYFYEPDIRYFDKFKSKKITKYLILLFVYLLPFISSIIISIIIHDLIIWLASIPLLFFIIIPIMYIKYYSKISNKKIAKSKNNLYNVEFYKYEKRLGMEKSKGRYWKIILILKIIIPIFILVCLICFAVKFGDDSYIWGIIWYIILMSLYPLFIDSDYRYNQYIFDTDASYILFAYGKWEKIKKEQ